MTWFAFRTAPQKEFSAEALARTRLGVTAFTPREIKWRRSGPQRVRTQHVYPMFPRYLFASIPSASGLRRVLELNPIQGVVGFGGVPASISNTAMENLMKLSGTVVPTRTAPVHRAFVPGDTVEISAGPFKGHVVPVLGIKGKHAKVLLELFGTPQVVRIEVEQIEAA